MSTAAPDNNLGYQNFFSGQLTSDITSSSTDIPMDTIPTSTMGFLVIEPTSTTNREVIFYNSKTALKVVCPSAAAGRGQDDTTAVSHSSGATVIMAPVSAFYEALANLSAMSLDARTGWVSSIAEGESWTYASWDSTNKTGTITIPSDGTTKYTLGTRIRMSQVTGGTKYFIVTKIAATVLTVYGGTDYTLNNETITSPYYSASKAPFGFPLDPLKWSVKATSTSSVSTTTTGGVFVNPGTLKITLPIGSWYVSWEAAIFQSNSSAGIYAPYGGLSTANNSASDNELIADEISRTSGTSASIWAASRTKHIAVTSATDYFLVITCQVGGGTLTVGWEGTRQTTVMRAVCSYL